MNALAIKIKQEEAFVMATPLLIPHPVMDITDDMYCGSLSKPQIKKSEIFLTFFLFL